MSPVGKYNREQYVPSCADNENVRVSIKEMQLGSEQWVCVCVHIYI